MNLTAIDNPKIVEQTAEAEIALRQGDTDRARALYEEAGKRIETAAQAHRKPSDKALDWFIAASQYYRGGLYQKAGQLCNRIQKTLLPSAMRPLYDQFFRDVRERERSDYVERIRKQLLTAWPERRYQDILDVLKDHPYIYPPPALAFLRAVCCEELGEFQAAALFHADAWRFSGERDTALLFLSATYSFALIHNREWEKAHEYIEQQMKRLPHALTYANASLMHYHLACKAAPEERNVLLRKQIECIDKARDQLRSCEPLQRSRDACGLMMIALEAAAFGLLQLEEPARALEMSNEAVNLLPTSADSLVVRGLITYPNAAAVQDFQEAIRRGSKSPLPFLFLAHAALENADETSAVSWCESGLQHNPSDDLRARLLELLAIARARLGESADAVNQLFAQASQLDPDNPRIRHNAEVFAAGSRDGDYAIDLNYASPPVAEQMLLSSQAESLSRRRPDRMHQLLAS
jgi:tetratricopeptide (TPR) repeat protein